MMDNCVADSSFYICWADDIGRKFCVHKFLDYYSFVLGPIILNEISRNYGSDTTFHSKVEKVNLDYSTLFEPIIDKNVDKGEYEAIGIAKFLLKATDLRMIIIDDGPARKLLHRVFPELSPYQCGTIGFVRECFKDGNISKEEALKKLDLIKNKVINNKDTEKRICSMTKKDHVGIIDPTIDEIRRI